MEKYTIVKLKCKDISGKARSGLAVYLGLNEEKEDYFLFYDKANNGFYRRTLDNESSYKLAGNLLDDFKKLFVDIAKNYERRYQIESELTSLKKEMRELDYKRMEQYKSFVPLTSFLPKEFPEELTKEAFADAVMENLPNDIKKQITNDGWKFENPTAIEYSSQDLYISREEVFDKYIGTEHSFVYRDGYGDIRLRSECEKDTNYQSIINRCRDELPVKAEFTDTLSIGDKSTLIYSACYHIPLEETLTAEYAKKIAVRLVDKTRSFNKILDDAKHRSEKDNNIKSDINIDKSR